ncbi:DNA-binding response regulator [Anaerocolumna cellulosilytica]|uniref:Stage 0 sporulation protein A homolog n=1 Tax=Anaerocolumna cellulosilytica TaxID=433286 RepID=A0A6S6QW61_9FIRM|nr:response regulator [Anaerocolumna cellulosilytica]MBB5196684.1 two-component system response regulator YesN [Anaerocolumna cellulosilytica]BCJ93946.1 DNA-binding response regulator [Anaerocolumna cellulosilytica]
MIKVFLVEDEIVIRNSIQKMIPWQEHGYELAGEAADGEIALPLIRMVKPDVLITDIKMPFMDGLALSKLVKKELPETKIVIISGYDDFEYARQAISLGVERYLLKPISRGSFIEVLKEIRIKQEAELEQKSYYEKFRNELQEFEQHARRDLFEAMVSGHVATRIIYEKAEKLRIDITAQCYNIVLFSMNSNEKDQIFYNTYSQETADLQIRLEQIFPNRPDYILFCNQPFSYAVLIKGKRETINRLTKECVNTLQEFFKAGSKQVDWFICTGQSVERISALASCYQCAMSIFASRFLSKSRTNSEHIHYENDNTPLSEEMDIKNIDSSIINTAIILDFLSHALEEEVNNFVTNYFKMIGEEAVKSRIFRQYILLNVHFSTVSFIQKLGFSKEELDYYLPEVCSEVVTSPQYAMELIKNILKKGIRLREESIRSRYKSVIDVATDYIHKNYMDDSLSLNKVACAANVSANHFSAIFSQEKKKTFIEYLTELRMNKAKELLRCTDMRSGEIALEVGYKDSHYFSFLFKKTQGCTPSDYRSKKGGIPWEF